MHALKPHHLAGGQVDDNERLIKRSSSRGLQPTTCGCRRIWRSVPLPSSSINLGSFSSSRPRRRPTLTARKSDLPERVEIDLFLRHRPRTPIAGSCLFLRLPEWPRSSSSAFWKITRGNKRRPLVDEQWRSRLPHFAALCPNLRQHSHAICAKIFSQESGMNGVSSF